MRCARLEVYSVMKIQPNKRVESREQRAVKDGLLIFLRPLLLLLSVLCSLLSFSFFLLSFSFPLHYNILMKLTLEEVEHIANLARLELTDEELQRFREQLSDILDYAARLQLLDTENIPPTSSVLPPRTVLREDRARVFRHIPELLDNAPRQEDHQYRVPPVMEEPEGRE